MASAPDAPGAAAIILFREVDRDDNEHTSHEDNYLRIKILTEEGRKYANVEIAFNKANDRLGLFAFGNEVLPRLAQFFPGGKDRR